MWNNLLEEDPYIQKIRAKRLAEGEAKGEARGEVIASQKMVLEFVEGRFPSLTELARERVHKIKTTEALRQLARQIAAAPDENTARQILDTYAA